MREWTCETQAMKLSLKNLNRILLSQHQLEETAKEEALRVKELIEKDYPFTKEELIDYLTQANFDLEANR